MLKPPLGEVVKAWLGQSDEPFLTIFSESTGPDDTVNYSIKVCRNTWVRPKPIHLTHVKRVEYLTRH